MLRLACLPILLIATACVGDETLTAYGAADKVWQLQSIDGTDFSASASLTFPEPGVIAGGAPCNSYRGRQGAPYPWFAAEALVTTRAACPDLAAEAAFLQTLGDMTLAEVAGDVLILSNDQGREMVFNADE